MSIKNELERKHFLYIFHINITFTSKLKVNQK